MADSSDGFSAYFGNSAPAAPAAATPSAAAPSSNDGFSAYFAAPTPTQQAAPKDASAGSVITYDPGDGSGPKTGVVAHTGASGYELTDGSRVGSALVTSVKPAVAPQTTTDDVSPFVGEFAGFTPGELATSAKTELAGLKRGVLDVAVPIARMIGRSGDILAASPAVSGNINDQPAATYPAQSAVNAANTADLANFEHQYGGNPLAQGFRLGAQAAATLPLGSGIGAIARPVVSALPYGETAADFLAGTNYGKGVVNQLVTVGSRAASGALQGATAGALTSGSSDEPLATQIGRGAELGAGLGAGVPLAVTGGRALGRGAAGLFAGKTAVANKIFEKFAGGTPNAVDASEIVPGSVPTMAEATGNAKVAGLQRAMRDINPNPFVEREQQNAAARNRLFESVSGTPEDIATAEAARAKITPDAVFQPGQVADPKPVINKIDSILSGPGGKRTAVRSVLENIKSKIVDADGNLTTDPATLYHSVRKEIGDLLDPKSAMANPAGRQAARELLSVQEELDKAISKAAPGFDKYLSAYAEASKPVDAMRFLQGLNIRDAQGNITLQKVQTALKNVNKLAQTHGANAAKSLTADQIGALEAIRDDLLRAQRTSLGKSIGSPTVQNAINQLGLGKAGVVAGKVVPQAVATAVGGALGHMAGSAEIGAAAGYPVGHLISHALESRSEAARHELENLLLHPGSYAPRSSARLLGGQNLLANPLVRTIAPYGVPIGTIVGNRLSPQSGEGVQ